MDGNRACYIQGLPDELLSQIFHDYVDLCDFVLIRNHDFVLGRNDLVLTRNDSYMARTTLCSINHRMRMLAITTPGLWTYIRLDSSPRYPPIPLLELCVERFGTVAPIHVDCYSSTRFKLPHEVTVEPVDEQHMIDAISLLRPHLHRWKSFKIFLTYGGANAFVELPLENAKSLEIITIFSTCDPDLNLKVLANIAKVQAPRDLLLDEIGSPGGGITPFRDSSFFASFPWKHLQRVFLSLTLSPGAALQMFSALTSANTINLQLCRLPLSARTELPPHGIICLPKLRSFTICADVEMYDVIQRLEMPGLTDFYVTWATRPGGPSAPSPIVEYTNFIIRNSASLKRSFFDLSGFDSGAIVEFLSNPELLCLPKARFYIRNDHASTTETIKGALESITKKKRGLYPYWGPSGISSTVVMGWDCGGAPERTAKLGGS